MRTPGEFATALFGERLPEGTYVATWALRGKRSGWWRTAQALDSLAGREDCFVGVALAARDYGPHRRLPTADAVGIGGLWLDIDVVGGPDRREHGAPSKDEAIRLGSSVLEPTLIVDSGHGIHTWHLLPEPWRFRSREEQSRAGILAARWYWLHGRLAREAGWHLDPSTRDLARVMRLPGTVNTKGGGHAAVEVLQADGPRYQLAELEAVAASAPVEIAAMGMAIPDEIGELRLAKGSQPPADLLRALLINSPEFDALWSRQRPDFEGDQSRYDLALAWLAVAAGWSDQDVATLIGAHRGWDAKAFRRDYLARTIGLARAGAAAVA